MPDDIKLGLRLTADGKGLVGEVRGARKEVDRLTSGVKRGEEANRRYSLVAVGTALRTRQTGEFFANARWQVARYAAAIRGLAGRLRDLAGRLRGLAESLIQARGRLLAYTAGIGAAIYVAVRLARTTTRIADSYTELNNRLRLVTESETQLIGARQALLDISLRTRTELAANAALYGRLSLASDTLGRSQAEILQVTELLNKQVLIGGSNASEGAAGLVQFAQGLASGRLQGDELRSVMENLLGVQQGLIVGFAKLRERGQIDFDVTRANIRELASQGVLSADLLLDAILASADDTDTKFADVTKTVSGGVTQMKSVILELVGVINQVTAGTGKLGTVFEVATDRIRGLADALAGDAGRDPYDNLLRRLAELDESIFDEERLRAQNRGGLFDLGAARVEQRALQRRLARGVDGAAPAPATGRAGPSSQSLLGQTPSRERPEDYAEQFTEQANQRLQQEIALENEAAQAIEDRAERHARAVAQINQDRLSLLPPLEQERAAAKEALRTALAGLDETAAGYDAQVADAKANYESRLARAEDEALNEQRERHAEAVAAINEANLSLLPPLEQARAAADQWRRDQLSGLSQAEAGYSTFVARVDHLYRHELAQAYEEDAERRREAADKALAESTRFEDGITRALLSYQQRGEDAASAVEGAVTRGLDSMTSSLTDFVTTGKFQFRDLVGSILNDLARIAIQRSLVEPLAQGLSGALGGLFGGGGGGGAAATGGFFAGVQYHTGGIVGADGRPRKIPAALLAGAPRLHAGGLAGDEVPAILRRGEEVLPANHPRHRANAGGAMTVNVTQSFDFRGADESAIGRLRAEAERIKRETVATVYENLTGNRRWLAATRGR